jgi:hypothetical protein
MFSFERSGTMKRIGPAAVLAVLFALPAPGLAQADKPAVKVESGKPATKASADGPRRSRATEDARSCLEFATNAEIARCAEQYR